MNSNFLGFVDITRLQRENPNQFQNVEVAACSALDANGNANDDYFNADNGFEQCSHKDDPVACWSVYLQYKDTHISFPNQLTCVADFPSVEEAGGFKSFLEVHFLNTSNQ